MMTIQQEIFLKRIGIDPLTYSVMAGGEETSAIIRYYCIWFQYHAIVNFRVSVSRHSEFQGFSITAMVNFRVSVSRHSEFQGLVHEVVGS